MKNNSETYPLFCVDRVAYSEENRYSGPFTTHDAAFYHLNCRETKAYIRRCRHVRPSEIALSLDCCDVDTLVSALDEAAVNGGLPDVAFAQWDDEVVKLSAGEVETFNPAAWREWADKHLSVDAFICEGDE